jgi:hypothetical protein
MKKKKSRNKANNHKGKNMDDAKDDAKDDVKEDAKDDAEDDVKDDAEDDVKDDAKDDADDDAKDDDDHRHQEKNFFNENYVYVLLFIVIVFELMIAFVGRGVKAAALLFVILFVNSAIFNFVFAYFAEKETNKIIIEYKTRSNEKEIEYQTRINEKEIEYKSEKETIIKKNKCIVDELQMTLQTQTESLEEEMNKLQTKNTGQVQEINKLKNNIKTVENEKKNMQQSMNKMDRSVTNLYKLGQQAVATSKILNSALTQLERTNTQREAGKTVEAQFVDGLFCKHPTMKRKCDYTLPGNPLSRRIRDVDFNQLSNTPRKAVVSVQSAVRLSPTMHKTFHNPTKGFEAAAASTMTVRVAKELDRERKAVLNNSNYNPTSPKKRTVSNEDLEKARAIGNAIEIISSNKNAVKEELESKASDPSSMDPTAFQKMENKLTNSHDTYRKIRGSINKVFLDYTA